MGNRPFLSHRSAGDGMQLSARDWNAIVDATKMTRGNLIQKVGARALGGFFPTFLNFPLKIKNNTGYDLAPFQIVKLGTPSTPLAKLTRFKYHLVFGAVAPVDTDPVIAVTVEKIRDGKVGNVMLNGLCPMQINVVDANDTYVKPRTGDVTKTDSTTGSGVGRILWKDTGTGTKWGLVMIPSVYVPAKLLCRFTANAAFTTASSSVAATITNQYGPGTSHVTTTITAVNTVSHTAGLYFYSGDSGDAGLAIWDSGTNWMIIDMECP